MPPVDFAAIGDNTIDRYLGDGGVDFVGGNALNVAVQLSRFGERVAYFGAVGDDADGARITAELIGHHVDLGGLDVAFCSIGGRCDPAVLAREGIEMGARLVVVTRGEAGAFASDGQREWQCAAAPVTVVDTTGAGDSFVAGFISARSRGADVQECLRSGVRAAARTCTHFAGFPQSERMGGVENS